MANAANTTSHTPSQSTKNVVLHTFELINDGALERADGVFHPEYVNHEHEDRPGGIKGFQDGMKRLRSSFSDLHLEVLDLVAEGDLVAARVQFTGTHDGQFNQIPPSGKRVSIQQIHFFRIQDGLIVENWACREEMKLMRQIGAMPGASR